MLPLETDTMALQSGLDTFTTQHVSLVSFSDNKGQQLSVRLYGGCGSDAPSGDPAGYVVFHSSLSRVGNISFLEQ